jgi:hypothetical protein
VRQRFHRLGAIAALIDFVGEVRRIIQRRRTWFEVYCSTPENSITGS